MAEGLSNKALGIGILYIIFGKMPLDLRTKALAAHWILGHDQETRSIMLDVESWCIEEWRHRYDGSTKGRHTYRLWPSITEIIRPLYGKFSPKLSDCPLPCTCSSTAGRRLWMAKFNTGRTEYVLANREKDHGQEGASPWHEIPPPLLRLSL